MQGATTPPPFSARPPAAGEALAAARPRRAQISQESTSSLRSPPPPPTGAGAPVGVSLLRLPTASQRANSPVQRSQWARSPLLCLGQLLQPLSPRSYILFLSFSESRAGSSLQNWVCGKRHDATCVCSPRYFFKKKTENKTKRFGLPLLSNCKTHRTVLLKS